MKRLLPFILAVWLLFIPTAGNSTVINLYGAVSACDASSPGCVNIPLTVVALCGPGVGCPNLSAPSFTDTNRFWGGGGTSCRTSNNGGSVWGNCTTQPLSSGAMEHYAGAGDGSVIVVGQIGVTCTIKRSTDNASNWTTVFTNGSNIGCGGALSGGSRLKCLSDGNCNFLFNNTNTNLPGLLSSSDNGQSWALTTVGVAGNNPISLAWNGSTGILTSNTLRSLKYAGGWSQGTAAFASCGNISGSVIFNGAAYGICKALGTNEQYRLMTPDGALFSTVTLPGAFQTASVGALAFSPVNNVIYFIASANTTPSLALSVWASRDGGGSFVRLYTSPTSLNQLGTGSDIFFSNGCLYFSGGGSAMFGRVC